MKNITIIGSLIFLALFPILLRAQEVQLPAVTVKASEDKVPFKVKEAVLNDFGENHKPFSWVSSRSLFSTFAWNQISDINNIDVIYYSVHTRRGHNNLDAVYSPEGKLISSREYFKNFRPSVRIMEALQNSDYKSWNLNSNFHVVRRLSNGSEVERYALKMVNGKEKKMLYFDKNGQMLTSKKGEFADAL